MIAIVLPGPPGARPLSLLGAPLLQRQLDWLRLAGVRRVGVARLAGERTPAALRPDALRACGVEIVHLPVAAGISPHVLASRFTPDADPIVVIGYDVLGDAPLDDAISLARSTRRDVRVSSGDADVLVIARRRRDLTPLPMPARGWIEALGDEATAHAVALDLLSGARRGVEIGASLDDKGVHRARGSFVHPDAVVIGPAYIGRRAIVEAGAVVGPSAILEEDAVVERAAEVRGARVAARTILGSGVTLVHAVADGDGITRHARPEVSLAEPLLVARRGSGGRELASRIVARALAAALALPAALGSTRAKVGGLLARLAFDGPCSTEEADVLLAAIAPPDAPPEAAVAALQLFEAAPPSTKLRVALTALYRGAAGVPL